MMIHKTRHNRLFKTIAIGAVCLFLVDSTFQGISYADIQPNLTSTLAINSSGDDTITAGDLRTLKEAIAKHMEVAYEEHPNDSVALSEAFEGRVNGITDVVRVVRGVDGEGVYFDLYLSPRYLARCGVKFLRQRLPIHYTPDKLTRTAADRRNQLDGSEPEIPVQGKPVSPQEAGITEQQYLAELEAYLRSLPQVSGETLDPGQLSREDVRHIAFFYPYALYTGGAGVVQRNMIEALLRSHRGLTIDLFYLNFSNAPSEWTLEDAARGNRVTLHGIPTQHATGEQLSSKERAHHLRTALQEIHSAQRVDLIVNNNSTPQFEMSKALWALANDAGIPFYMYFHGGLLTEGVKYLMEHSDAAATNSEVFQGHFSKLGVQLDVIHPIPDLSFFMEPLTPEEQKSIEQLLEQHNLKGTQFFLHPARLYPFKGQEDTILAAKIFQRDHPELAVRFPFVILGPSRNVGEERRLRDFAEQQNVAVVFVGKQSREQMRLWYRAAYAVLYPTRGEEPFGLVPVEAQASGTPVIVTDVGGLPETLQNGITGFIVPRTNSNQLAQACFTLASDPQKRQVMAGAAEDYAHQRYPPENTSWAFVDSYLQAVRNRRRKEATPAEEFVAFPEYPGKVLFSIYASTYTSGVPAGGLAGEQAIVEEFKRAWERKLDESRPHWLPHPTFPFPYNKDAPFVAYDPKRISARTVGSFLRLILPAMPDREEHRVTREDRSHSKLRDSRFLDDLASRVLIEDPFNPNLHVVINRYPKVMYDSMFVSRDRQPQRLTQEAIRAEIQWARRGMVSDFHHPEGFIDHLHVHLYPALQVPVFNFVDSFVPEETLGDVSLGEVGYPVPHAALASSDDAALEDATLLLADQLEEAGHWFTQTVLPPLRDDKVVILFHILAKRTQLFSFSPVGFLKTPDESITDEQLLRSAQEEYMDVEATVQAQEAFWAEWKARSRRKTDALHSIANLRKLNEEAEKEDEELIVLFDTTIGDVNECAGDLFEVLEELHEKEGLNRIRLIADEAQFLNAKLDRYLKGRDRGTKRKRKIVAVIKNDHIQKRRFTTGDKPIKLISVDDAEAKVIERGSTKHRSIPISKIVRLSLKSVLGKPLDSIPGIKIEPRDGILYLIVLPNEEPVINGELRRRYKEEAEFMKLA